MALDVSEREIPKGLKVFYGLRKLTPKMVKKPSIIVMYENTDVLNSYAYVQRVMHLLYQRKQTDEERQDANLCFRSFSVYEYFLSDKKYNGSVEKLLDYVFFETEKFMSVEQRKEVCEIFRSEIYDYYKLEKENRYQLKFDF